MDNANPSKATAEQAEEAAAFAANMAKVVERSQDIWMKLMAAQMGEEQKPRRNDPLNAMPAFAELQQTLMANPQEVAERTLALWTDQFELWRRATVSMFGGERSEPVTAPAQGDKRFKAKDWESNQVFDYMKQSYLLASGYLQNMSVEVGDMDERDRKKVAFFTRQFVEALSPSNFAALNPDVINATIEQKGENLIRGLKMMAEDLERGKGTLLIRQTDMDAFEVGRNMALTPGKVVARNNVMELIQYAPATEKVHAVPLVICPPWINKYYILDLNPAKSLVKWLTEQGFTVFLISWINPSEAQKDETWDSYMRSGLFTAIDVALEETGQKQVNLASYCIGGTMAATSLAYMCKTDDRRVKSCTFFTALTDFEDGGELQVFVDQMTLQVVDEQMTKGFLPASAMANAFNMLRSSDLIWGYVVNNYYLGKDPFPFDLLYWNADSTAMPAQVHHHYLDTFYNKNQFTTGELTIGGVQVEPADITVPVYHMASKEDHIAPAASVYAGTRNFTKAELRFVLAGSGHIAGVVNPPDAGKYQHWTNEDPSCEALDTWIAGATETAGSWWPDWAAWLAKQSGRKVAGREPGAVSGAITDAPGDYVRVRFDAA
jgi:polyhydroxyalkanoate synthase